MNAYIGYIIEILNKSLYRKDFHDIIVIIYIKEVFKLKKMLLIVLLVISLFTVAACKENKVFTVSFNTNGGSVVETVKVKDGEVLTLDTEPEKANNTFRYWYLTDKTVPYDFSTPVTMNMVLSAYWSQMDVELATSKTFNFTNLTEEYSVSNGSLELFYTNNGNVPYVKVMDYLNLLDGFIDPEVEFTVTESEENLNLSYQYYSEEEDKTYDLGVIFDLKSNIIHTSDPAFYWAYIYSTETNYGRNIEYLYDHEKAESTEGETVIYNLNEFQLDLVYHDGAVLAPYYLVNQLFAGSSYYNVYFNGDALYGVYGSLSSSDSTYSTIRRSSLNNTDVPADLLSHNYHMLAFNLEHFYGLKEYKGIKNFYTELAKYYSQFHSTNPNDVSQALADYLMLELDEPHTSFGFSGYHSKLSYNPPTNSLSNYGEHYNDWYMNGLSAVNDVIAAKWKIYSSSSWAANSSLRPKYWLLDEKNAVISFDEFVTADIEETNVWSTETYTDVFGVSPLPADDSASRYLVYNQTEKLNLKTETLLYDAKASFVADYAAKLVRDGFTHVYTPDIYTDYRKDGYYTKNIDGKDYMVLLGYDTTHKLGYIGLTTKMPTEYQSVWPLTASFNSLIESDSAVYLESMIKKVKELYPQVERIGLDITFNTGGNVGALYRVVGLITDNPFEVSSYSRDTNVYQTSIVDITTEAYDEYEWFLLTSYVTFSAANEMATIFKQNELGKIIGQTSGGGASSITPILLPDGSFFTTSSNNVNTLKDKEGNYVINESGIKPDFEIPQNKLYDAATLLEILNR